MWRLVFSLYPSLDDAPSGLPFGLANLKTVMRFSGGKALYFINVPTQNNCFLFPLTINHVKIEYVSPSYSCACLFHIQRYVES